MKRGLILLVLLLIPSVLAECNQIENGKTYSGSHKFCGETFFAPDGITVTGKDITLDCGTAVIRGTFENPGITIIDSENVVIQNCHVANYEIGVLVVNSTHVTFKDSNIIRNLIGIKLIDSNDNYFEHISDISLEEMVIVINSTGNYFDYTNKNLEDDLCRYNNCNKVFVEEEQSLLDALNSAIKNWLSI